MRSLVNVLGSDQWSEDVVPTVAFNLRQVRKGNVTMKVWDVAVSLVPLMRVVLLTPGPTQVPRDVGPVLSWGRRNSVRLTLPFTCHTADEQICRGRRRCELIDLNQT